MSDDKQAKREDDEGELHTIENDILPDLRKSLADLTSPDYKPEDNPDDELREQDIEYLTDEIAVHERKAAALRKRLGK